MNWNHRNRLAFVLFALVSLLFTQFAVAGYVCPADASGGRQFNAMSDAAMPCAGSMDSAIDNQQSGLCHAHCNAGHQSAGDYQLPSIAAFTDLSTGFRAPKVLLSPLGEILQTTHLKRTTAPPLAVRHCCFRI